LIPKMGWKFHSKCALRSKMREEQSPPQFVFIPRTHFASVA